jgi:hypothetical protein
LAIFNRVERSEISPRVVFSAEATIEMIPIHQQQSTSHRSVPQFGFDFPPQQQPVNLQQYGLGLGLGPMDMQMNWQGNGSMGGFTNGQHMSIQPPPFLYPIDRLRWTESSFRKNQVKPLPMTHVDRGPLVTPRGHRRGILKHTDQPNTPTQRRLVHFMPEQWQREDSANINSRKRSGKRPISGETIKENTGKGYNLDTIRRRERRQRSRAVMLNSSKEFILPNDNRFIVLSETDEEGTDDIDQNHSEAESEEQAMKSNRQQRNLLKQANTTTEVAISGEHVVMNKSKQPEKTRGNNQQQVTVPNLEIEEKDISLNESDQENEEFSLARKGKQRTKFYLQAFKIHAYLKTRVNNDRKLKLEFKDVFNEVCAYAQSTVGTYDEWIKNNYEVQVWQRFYELG